MVPRNAFLAFIAAVCLVPSVFGQSSGKTVFEIYTELERFENDQRKAYASRGERFDANDREKVMDDRRDLAKKYAIEIEARSNLESKDFYYLGRIYSTAKNDKKALESMQKFIARIPPNASGDIVKSALAMIVSLSSSSKQMDVAEAAYVRFIKTDPIREAQQPVLQDHLATGFYKTGNFEKAIAHAQEAFDLLRTLQPRSTSEKRSRETIYMNLVEVLALGYKKNKNQDQALNILAEARAQSFTIPSANLYRKVMDFVEGSGFSEKKMMQKIDSYATADPAPELEITDWIGQEPTQLSEYRGKVVLLDFWATWCGPCIATFPRLRGWHKKYAGNDLVIVGVTKLYGEQDGKRMSKLQELDYLEAFRRQHKLPYAFAVTRSGDYSVKYGIAAYPTTVLLDRNGVVRYIGIGAGLEESTNLEDTIKKVLAERPILAAVSN